MKQFSYVLLLLSISGCVLPEIFLDNGDPAISTTKITLPTVQCKMCQNTITQELNELEGVQTVYVNLNEEKVLVKYNSTKVTIDDIKQVIIKLGYQADDVPADIEAYNNLPGCCKLPEDR